MTKHSGAALAGKAALTGAALLVALGAAAGATVVAATTATAESGAGTEVRALPAPNKWEWPDP